MIRADELRLLSPTVSRIASTVKDRISTGIYPVGQWLPTERALAEEFRVSRILIRSAIKELERQKLIACSAHRRPVVQQPADGHQGISLLRNRSLALWISLQPTWPGAAMIIKGIQEAEGNPFRIVLGSPVGDSSKDVVASEAWFLQQIVHSRDICGLILDYKGGTINLSHLESLSQARIPMVFLDHHPPSGFEADYVGVNNKRGIEQIIRHLVLLGHRHIGYVSNFDNISTVHERLAGYRKGLEIADIPFRPELVASDPGPSGNDPHEGCEELVGRFLNLTESPTAICAVNDIGAFRVIAALRVHGIRVPNEMSVTGFDGVERWMPSSPFLTTVYQPFEAMGAHAVELLTERIQNTSTTCVKHIILDTNLAIHASTAPPFQLRK